MQQMKITSVTNETFAWGESACWDDASSRFYCVDCEFRELRWVDASNWNQMHRLVLPSLPTALYLTETPGRVLMQLDNGLCAVEVSTSEIKLVVSNPPGEPRFNDGVVDPSGAIVTGTLLFGSTLPVGSYWRYGKPAGWEPIHRGKGNTNGPCFSPDGKFLYVADSSAGCIYRFDYGPGRALHGQRLFADTNSLGGLPDGAAVDSEGCLWTTVFGGSKLVRYRPDGSPDQLIELPASHPTSVAFGGNDFQTAFVTTIRTNSFGINTQGEMSGSLIKIEGLGVRGLARNRCKF
jgi:sugar lactone lactonase YvrE